MSDSKEPKIVGAQPISDKEPQIISQRTKGSPLEIRKNESKVVSVKSHTRTKPKK